MHYYCDEFKSYIVWEKHPSPVTPESAPSTEEKSMKVVDIRANVNGGAFC